MNYQKLAPEQSLDLTARVHALVEDMDFEARLLRGTEFGDRKTVWDYKEADRALTIMEKHFENFRKKRLQMDEARQWLLEDGE